MPQLPAIPYLLLLILTISGTAGADPPAPLAPVFPDVELIDADGRPLRFYCDLIKDQTVAINFIYTSCTMVCPLLGVTFAAVQRALPTRIGNDLRLISISIDPVTDSPQRLSEWRGQVGGDDNGWTLLTGSKRNIDTVLKALQVFTAERSDHSGMVIVGNDSTGQWQRLSGLASAEVIRAQLEAMAMSSEPSSVPTGEPTK